MLRKIKELRALILTDDGRKQVRTILSQLTPREKAVLEARIGLNPEGPLTLKQISKKMGVNDRRVLYLENRALRMYFDPRVRFRFSGSPHIKRIAF